MSSDPVGHVLVQRADAAEEDVDRARALADALGADLRATDGPEDLDAVIDGLDGQVLVVCGGDGSIHLAVNHLVASERAADVVVALLPCGTGNDLAHTLDLSHDPSEVADRLRTGRVRALDVLEVVVDGQDRGVAVNALHAGIGFEAADRAQELKDSLGDLAYPVGSLAAGLGAEGLDLAVTVDDEPVGGDGPVLMVGAVNGRTIGGGYALAPDADPGDGLLDVLVSRAVGPAARAAYGLALARGAHVDRDDVELLRGTRVVVEGPMPGLNVDGELWDGPFDRLEVAVRAGVVRFLGA